MKQTEAELRKCVLLKLAQMKDSDPSKYWSLLKTLRNESKSDTDPIKPDEWIDHFKSLLHVPTSEKDQFQTLLDETECLLKNNIVLDSQFTENEILSSIKCIKNRKSPGPDGILNEMLKTGRFMLLKSITKLMQFVFDSGQFPDTWNKGILVKLFKSGDNSEPDNYRGILLSSALGQ